MTVDVFRDPEAQRHTTDVVTGQIHALLMLERLGYRADVAVDGYETLAAIRRQRYDLVLMDVHMPGMDGLEAPSSNKKWNGWRPGSRRRDDSPGPPAFLPAKDFSASSR